MPVRAGCSGPLGEAWGGHERPSALIAGHRALVGLPGVAQHEDFCKARGTGPGNGPARTWRHREGGGRSPRRPFSRRQGVPAFLRARVVGRYGKSAGRAAVRPRAERSGRWVVTWIAAGSSPGSVCSPSAARSGGFGGRAGVCSRRTDGTDFGTVRAGGVCGDGDVPYLAVCQARRAYLR